MFHVRRRCRRRGFTLTELMAVIAIVAVMGAIAMATLSGAGNGQNAAGLARSLELVVMGARAAAISDGFVRRVHCSLQTSGSWCSVDKATTAGAAPTAWTTESTVRANSHATVWAVTASTDVTAQNPAHASGDRYVYVKTDGSVGDATNTTTGATFYVSDSGGTNTANRYKVYVYSATGMPRLVNQW